MKYAPKKKIDYKTFIFAAAISLISANLGYNYGIHKQNLKRNYKKSQRIEKLKKSAKDSLENKLQN